MILHVVGARPNFMKLGPVWRALSVQGVPQLVVHTGQHYDANMSDIFFTQLRLPCPDVNLEVGATGYAQQTAAVIQRIEPVLLEHRPDWVIVYGDVNSTMAATITACKLGIRVVHVEAGLRSFDRSMPEELNRLITDQLADLLLTPSDDANRNLFREGIPERRIRLVGNVMIDTLIEALPRARRPDRVPDGYILVTLHRPGNVDEPAQLRCLIEAVAELTRFAPVVFPMHPRTTRRLEEMGLDLGALTDFHPLPPQGYLEFLALQRDARVVVTDSGGVQEETTYLQVPCLTMRENTERPITVQMGTNRLIGRDCGRLITEVRAALTQDVCDVRSRPPLWDGGAGSRIAQAILEHAGTCDGPVLTPPQTDATPDVPCGFEGALGERVAAA